MAVDGVLKSPKNSKTIQPWLSSDTSLHRLLCSLIYWVYKANEEGHPCGGFFCIKFRKDDIADAVLSLYLLYKLSTLWTLKLSSNLLQNLACPKAPALFL